MSLKCLLKGTLTASALTLATATVAQESDVFTRFDADGNAAIAENEFSDGIFGLFDTDGNDGISEEEYNTGVEQFYGGDFGTAFADFDGDADGSISSEEFTNTYPNDLYSAFDNDGNGELNESEFSGGLFGIADANDDGILGEDEFNTNSSWWGDAGFADFDADNSGDISETEFNETFVGLGGIGTLDAVAYEPYGVVEVGDYELIDNDVGGNLAVTTISPSDQGVDVVLIGPYGYKSVNEIVDEEIIEDLPAGTYIVAATDDNLEMVTTKVDVNVGQLVPVTLTLNAIDTTDYNPGYDPYGFFDFAYEPIDSPDLGELNVLFDYEQDFQPAGLVGSIIGPDDYRQDLDGETDTVELDGLVPGNYLIAVSTQGGDLAEGIVEVRAGEAANVTMTLSGLAPTQ